MNKLSPQSKSFIVLFGIAVVGTYVCLMLWGNLFKTSSTTYNNSKPNANPQTIVADASVGYPPVPYVDTSAWKNYTNAENHLSFLYKPGWKVLPEKKGGGFTVLQVDPGAKYYNIKIYISPKEFYIMDGLPTKTETIDGKETLNVGNALYGITANNLYYTFDVGLSMSLVPDFNALVHSVKFEN